MSDAYVDILQENERRISVGAQKFNPITGEGSVGERERVELADFPLPMQYLPTSMLRVELVRELLQAGSLRAFCDALEDAGLTYDEKSQLVIQQFVRLRCLHDFAFWAAMYVYIKLKGGGDDVLFRLNRPQRKIVKILERMRLAGKPMRIILLKARQWGGSTVIQLYMAWLQLVHKKGLNSLIIAHQGMGSDEIQDMFERMIQEYPTELLYDLTDEYSSNEPKWVGVGKSGNIHRVPQRNCKIKIGTAERPHSCRGGDYNLVHCSEVALWGNSEKKTPEDIVRSACSGVLYRPYTLIAYESTPNGTGNFFHREYIAAKKGKTQFEAVFVSWYEIEAYAIDFRDAAEREAFACRLYDNRDNDQAASDREEPGTYLWWLWQQGATLEAINWYIQERTKYGDHADIASEYPSDDIEAFTFSGRKVFAADDVEQLRDACRPPRWVGEIYGREDEGELALDNLRFKKEEGGRLHMWQDVENDEAEEVANQYVVAVDVCKGHTKHADFADILVINRVAMIDAEPPSVVAEWHGHIDMDKLAWKATQIAEYYNHALLVIESNTLETNNTKGEAEYILNIIRDVYDNLYARKQSAEDIRAKAPLKYGFHTNTLTKKVIIHNLRTVIREHLYIERCVECLEEYLTYIETEKGGYEAMEGYHDDRLMTRAIGLQVSMKEMDMPEIIRKNKHTQPHHDIVSAATM